jgi:hypothetical protein
MSLRIVSGLFLLGFSTPALAAGNLTTSITAPSSHTVYTSANYTLTLANVGNKSMYNTYAYLDLPQTHTSPGVYVMGTVGTLPTGCSRTNARITCVGGTVTKYASKSWTIPLTFPEAAETLTLNSSLSTSSTQVTTDDTSSRVAPMANVNVSFPNLVGDVFDLNNDHCTGTGLTSYYECTLFPSSITSHEATFEVTWTSGAAVGGTVSFPTISADYGGTWESTTPDHLWFEITELGTPVADFEGYGTNNTTGNCWEGITNFLPTSAYLSPYRVCVL